jgi:hypothetical protein
MQSRVSGETGTVFDERRQPTTLVAKMPEVFTDKLIAGTISLPSIRRQHAVASARENFT